MSRLVLFLVSTLSLTVCLQAQERIVATRVFAEPTGSRFFVDGVPYLSAQTFMWTAGSRHTLFVENEQNQFPGTRTKFQNWADSTGRFSSAADTVTIIADPSISFFKATFSTEFLMRLIFYQCNTTQPGACRPPGTVSVGGSLYSSDAEIWQTPGSEIVLQAYPNPGFVFGGWGPPSNNSMSFIYTHRMNGPVTFTGMFAQGKRVTLRSDPPDLMVAPDRAPQLAPAEMDWAMGSRHVLGVVSPQSPRDNAGILFVFQRWSNGAGAFDWYTVPNNNEPETITAHYVPGARASFLTSPPGLRLRVEGRDNWASYNFVWGQGMKYPISAPLEQTDQRGRRWVFKGWSNEGPATQEITVTPEHVRSGLRLTATYEAQSRVTITSNPPGILLQVDGEDCRGTCTIFRSEGSQVRISAPASLALSDSTRLEFSGWTDNSAPSRMLTVTGDMSLTASYRNLYRLTTLAEPGNSGLLRIEPPSPDGFYEADTVVNVTAETRPGFRFRRWEGDLGGTFRSGNIAMTVPRVVRALFDIAPFADQAGVRNAAGETPDPGVAPGSIASIFGANLAGEYTAGPTSPLAQTLGGVTVRLGNRLLPLLFVSPEQINIQVPSDLEEGTYQLAIRWQNYPEVLSPLRITRNAPGLFEQRAGTGLHAVAASAEGRSITFDAPAKPGDLITLFGTGFGPYQRPAIDGFPLPDAPGFVLADPLEVLIGDTVINPEWAGGAPGQIGTAQVRFTLPADLPVSESGVRLRVRVNGRESNPVLLPVR
jgi:uncharacterized protein (TIGR03437 family)